MKNYILTLALVINYVANFAQNYSFDWVTSLQSGSNQSIIFQIATDNDSNVIVGGYFTDSLIYNSTVVEGTQNVKRPYIAKYNAAGVLQWLNHYTSPYDVVINGLKTDDQNNIIAVGTHRGGVDFGDGSGILTGSPDGGASTNGTAGFILKLSESGQPIWVKNYRSNTFKMDDLSIQANEIYCLMRYRGSAVDMDLSANVSTVPFPSFSDPRAIVLKLDENGNFLWANGFQSKSNNLVKKAKMVTTDNYTYITGDYFTNAADSSVFTLGTPSLKLPTPASNSADIFIAKLNNTDGVVAKVIGIGNTADESVIALEKDIDGNIYLLGLSNLTLDVDPSSATQNITINNNQFLVKYNENLEYLSAMATEFGNVEEVELDAQNNIYMAGYCLICSGNINGPGAFVYKMNPNFVFQDYYKTSNLAYGYAFKLTNNKIYLGGDFFTQIDFDMDPNNNTILTPTLGSDAFLLSINIESASASLEESSQNLFSVYPNPASSSVSISNLTSGTQLSLKDISGKTIETIIVNQSTIDLSLTNIPNGMYIIIIENNGAIAQKKLVVNK